MPYQVKDGQQVDSGGTSYKSGAFVPGARGELADMEEVGVVEWQEAPVREPAKKVAPAKPAHKAEKR